MKYKDFYSHLLFENVGEDFELYHGTSESIEKIKLDGLKLSGKHSAIFLTDNPQLAMEYAMSDAEQRTGSDKILLISVKISELDLNYLKNDIDHNTCDTWEESLSDCDQVMYFKNIPPEKLSIEQYEI